MPESLGPYRIESELGSGGMGTVYSARVDGRVPGLAVGARVALKVLHPHLLDAPGFFKRFLQEASIGQAVRHPNVVRTLDCDAAEGRHFLAMEYVEGRTLRDLLRDLDRVPEELCRHIGHEVAKGLAAIHAAGVIHRDVKPENVLITPDHIVKVMDLGVARLAEEAVRLSQTGAFVGSVQYAAPEQFRGGGGDLDGRADLHALGLVLYELSCGVQPYVAPDVAGTIHNVLGKTPRRLGAMNPQLTPFFEEVVHALLEKDRDKRFASADELAQVLGDGEASSWWRRQATAIRQITKRPLRRVRIPRETAVYGRDEELARLRALFDAAVAGEGGVLLIDGEAGIGKSRLVDEVIGRLQRDGADLNFLFGSYPPGGAATAAGGFSIAYREQFGDAGSATYLATTPALAPAFDALLRGEPAPPGVQPLTQDSLQTCFVNATRALAAERPTVVLIDDLHFAPEEGRALFTALSLAAPEHRVLLIGTVRPGVPEQWVADLTRFDQTSQLSLHRLGPKDLMALLRDSLHSDRLADELAGQIALKSDGNPFFVFEMLQGLREGQFITRQADGSWARTKLIEDIGIPSSVLDLVNARVAGLTDDERNLLDVAACGGFDFDPSLVGSVLGIARVPVLQAFARIEKRHRLVRSAGRSYVFDHHQVQESLYGALNHQLREAYHAALADALAASHAAAEHDPAALDGGLCVRLCDHYLRGARGTDAVRYQSAAFEHLMASYLNAEAADLLERVLTVPGLLIGASRVETLLTLCGSRGPLDRMGRRVRQRCAAEEAERLAREAGDGRLAARAADALGACLLTTSHHAEAEAALGRAIDWAREAGDAAIEASAVSSLGSIHRLAGRLDDAQRCHEQHLVLVRRLGDRKSEARALGNLGVLHQFQGRLDDAVARLEEARAVFRELGERWGDAQVSAGLGNIFVVRGLFEAAVRNYEHFLAVAREFGDRADEALIAGNLANALSWQGRLTEALERTEHALLLSRETGFRHQEASLTVIVGSTLAALGRPVDARVQFDRALEMARDAGNRTVEAYALHNLAEATRDDGDFAGAARVRALCDTVHAEIGDRTLAAQSALLRGALSTERSCPDEAREAFEEALRIAEEVGLPGEATRARCHLATVPGGDVQAAIAAFDEYEDRLTDAELRESRLLLWRATGDRAHLVAAKRALDASLARVSDDARVPMVANVRVNREIMAAWQTDTGAADGPAV